MFKPLKIALASYDRKELRVQKHYLEEEGAPISCTCFLSGERLFRCLQQDHSFDVAILCNEMEDMTGLEFMEHIRALEQRPVLLLFNEARRNNESALCMETEEGIFCVEQADLKSLLRELYRMPGQQGQKLEHRCMELYAGWGIRLPDANADYLTCAVSIVYSSSQKLAIRKEILQAVGQQFDISVSAVDSGIRRMIDQLEAEAGPAWTGFKRECGFDTEKPTTGKLIYAVKNRLQQHSTV